MADQALYSLVFTSDWPDFAGVIMSILPDVIRRAAAATLMPLV